MGLFLLILGWIWSIFFGLGVAAMLAEKDFRAVVLFLALMAPGFVMIKKGSQRRDAAVPLAPPPLLKADPAPAPQPPPAGLGVEQPQVQVKCRGCGAGNVIRFGTTEPCEFCGALLALPTYNT